MDAGCRPGINILHAMTNDPESWKSLSKDFEEGLPIPAADPALLKKLWDGMRHMGAELDALRNSDRATGLGVIGFCPENLENRPHMDFHCAWLRSFILGSLDHRNVLEGYRVGETYREEVFQAIATFPCTKNEIGECLTLRMVTEEPARPEWVEMKQKATAHGYDFSKPEIDSKFLAYLEQRASEASG